MPHVGHVYPILNVQMFEVRNSVCVAGCTRDAVLTAKTWIAGLVPDSLGIESFHVKRADDVKDGALFVPKVILAATHLPGQKLLDNTSNTGQLDWLYDEVCQIGGEYNIWHVDKVSSSSNNDMRLWRTYRWR